jgi:hypothetical protein
MRPPENPALLDALRRQTLQVERERVLVSMFEGPAGVKRQLARAFGQTAKAFKKMLRRERQRKADE